MLTAWPAMKGALCTSHCNLSPDLRVLKSLVDSLQQSKLRQGEGPGGSATHDTVSEGSAFPIRNTQHPVSTPTGLTSCLAPTSSAWAYLSQGANLPHFHSSFRAVPTPRT